MGALPVRPPLHSTWATNTGPAEVHFLAIPCALQHQRLISWLLLLICHSISETNGHVALNPPEIQDDLDTARNGTLSQMLLDNVL